MMISAAVVHGPVIDAAPIPANHAALVPPANPPAASPAFSHLFSPSSKNSSAEQWKRSMSESVDVVADFHNGNRLPINSLPRATAPI
jgi:hypothetical protein